MDNPPVSIYVHGSNAHFNTLVYVMMRAIHLPILDGQELPLKDTWFAVPAMQHGPMVSLVSNEVEIGALMIIDGNGRTVKAHRVSPMNAPLLEGYQLEAVKKEAFDIPLWEKTNNRAFPYATMFDKQAMAARYKEVGATPTSVMNVESENKIYNSIRRRVQPSPCRTCGGKK